MKQRYLANHQVAAVPMSGKWAQAINDPFYPRFWEERLWQFHKGDYDKAYPTLIMLAEKERGIFVCDMGELFGDWIPREWQDKVFSVIRAHPQHRFYLLTKQPQNLIKFSHSPELLGGGNGDRER